MKENRILKKVKMILDRFVHRSFSSLLPTGKKVLWHIRFFTGSIFSRYPVCRLASIGRAVCSVKGAFMEAQQTDSEGIVYGIGWTVFE